MNLNRSTPPQHDPSHLRDLPPEQGLYSPLREHDACGLNFVVNLKGVRSHDIVAMGIGALCSLQHRGALGAESNTGDGAGIMLQVPDAFYREEVDFALPPERHYATGIAFLPQSSHEAEKAVDAIERIVADEGLNVLGWRVVPIDASMLGAGALSTMPRFQQLFIDGGELSGIDLDRRTYVIRKRIEHEIHLEAGTDEANEAMGGQSETHDGVYFPSLNSRTIVYKGMLTTPQLAEFYPELVDERVVSAIALVHSRFSTNTFPSWPLAHPYRYVVHNGEINTVAGNQNWMRAREAQLDSPAFGSDIEKLFPICTPGGSDTARFDEALELLILSGYSLPEAALMMIPEPWENHDQMSDELRAFYRYHAARMEPWDGPASVALSDGDGVAAVLDRNGLRPSRYWVTSDDLVIMASEVGVVDIDPAKIIEKGRLQPGKMFYIDLAQGRIIRDDEIKSQLAASRPHRDWLEANQVKLSELPRAQPRMSHLDLSVAQTAFGYTHEELKLLLAPMARDGKEAIGSMGTDTPVAVLSKRPRMLYDYFQQLFAQVTNPPLDAMREEIITATYSWLGSEANLLDPQPESCQQIMLEHPVITNAQLATLDALHGAGAYTHYRTTTVDCVYDVSAGGEGLKDALAAIRDEVSAAVAHGSNLLILSDRQISATEAPVPMLLAIGAVHHHLVAEKSRARVGLIAETGEVREVHQLALLLGFGADAVNPYLAFDSVNSLIESNLYGLSPELTPKEAAYANLVKATDKGILKVMSKMGISTVKSYIGAQIFEAIGVGDELIDAAFVGTASRLGGVGFDQIAKETAARHALAFPANPGERAHRDLEVGGEYQWRQEGEYHLFNPETIFKLQHATREGRYDIFQQYTTLIDDQSNAMATLRGLFAFGEAANGPIPIDEVEPATEIVKRFATGAMSYGSISSEAHETLAIAMNRIGAKSNTGEGGEDSARYTPDANGDSRRSSIKQAASGRFGVTSQYLSEAEDIQIKMAQGAKPGEGGQLPGHKVYPWIAEVRHSTPGVGLISPPPHHDIYSIEDLAQLIYDLKNANPSARIHVKLVSELGVGTVAAGVSKAHADVILISGHDGGTGASPLTSIKHCGTPWELGLAETQQTLLLNNLRDRVVVQVDGQLKTGRDVVIAALLGGEEFGFATAPLVVMGCVMMRVCHLDTCPVGVATQNPDLRAKFTGQADHVVNFMMYIAEEVRELLASLGLRSIQEAVGRVDLLDMGSAIDHWKADGLDLSPILYKPEVPEGSTLYNSQPQDHGLHLALDNKLIELSAAAIESKTPVEIDLPIGNVNRSVGTMLGHQVTTAWGGEGLPDDTIMIRFTGSAGNSMGAFMPSGITLDLTGDANDYVGKGLSGGRIVIRIHPEAPFVAHEHVIAGNVILYGATAGELFLNGVVGERFCVRNSGAVAVVEGVGDHACEYMTGGRAVILGATGRNFGAGMSGGLAFVYDINDQFEQMVNPEMVDLEAPTPDDLIWLEQQITKHHDLTGSVRAQELLADWATTKEMFHKVMPKDFKRVASALQQAAETGADPDLAVMAAARG